MKTGLTDLPKLPKSFHDFMPAKTNKAILPEDLKAYTQAEYHIEEKYDGSCYMARFISSKVLFSSRRISEVTGKAVDKTDNVPHINKGTKELHGTLVIGEMTHAVGAFDSVRRVMGSKPDKAIKLQEKIGRVEFKVHDCVFYKGTDIRDRPRAYRRMLGRDVMRTWRAALAKRGRDPLYVTISPLIKTLNVRKAYQEIVDRGGEGLMIKDKHAPYGKGSFKCKKHHDVSVVVTGYKEANEGKTGKFKGLIGSIEVSVYDPKHDSYIAIGWASGMDDNLRRKISRHRERYMHKVLDVRCQPPDNPEKFVPGEQRLRHPRFVRFRTDLSPKQCSIKKIKEDFLSMVKG